MPLSSSHSSSSEGRVLPEARALNTVTLLIKFKCVFWRMPSGLSTHKRKNSHLGFPTLGKVELGKSLPISLAPITSLTVAINLNHQPHWTEEYI